MIAQELIKTQVKVEDVWKSFDRGRIEVLKGVSLDVPEGGVVALLGANGAGKSSTIKMILDFLKQPERGRQRRHRRRRSRSRP